ncbi:MAG: hypothetical protein HY984_01415 [Candidatus Magasanikbacteria bacterium]|nr:hypothetical protein [Candidatus Magasanikbacteria bacterium]
MSAVGIFLFSFPHSVRAEDYGLGATAQNAGLKDERKLPDLIGAVIGTGLSMIGVLFFILMVYGGFLWMTAHGNEDQSKKALNTIIAATIGIIIVMASYAITRFVFSRVNSAAEGGRCELRQPVPSKTPACAAGECIGVPTSAACNQKTCCTWNE